MPDLCPACGAPSDDWPHDFCQDCWEAYCDAMWWETEGGVYVESKGFTAQWIKERREEGTHG